MRHGVPEDSIDVAWVPGSFEIPLVATQDGGERPVRGRHLPGLRDPRRDGPLRPRGRPGRLRRHAGVAFNGVPVIFGILTTDTVEQALNRAGLKGGNKGADAAMAAIEMVNLLAKLEHEIVGSVRDR